MKPEASVRTSTLAGKRVFVRGRSTCRSMGGARRGDTRIAETLALKLARERGAELVLAYHLGEPKAGRSEMRLRPVAGRLADLAGERGCRTA